MPIVKLTNNTFLTIWEKTTFLQELDSTHRNFSGEICMPPPPPLLIYSTYMPELSFFGTVRALINGTYLLYVTFKSKILYLISVFKGGMVLFLPNNIRLGSFPVKDQRETTVS